MITTRAQRGSRVIYVAASARELAQEVQDWLGQPSIRASASPDIYDTLAQLAEGKSPLALIVSMESVDWTELEFFPLVHRVCPDALIYVTGAGHQEAKMEAALARGARRFDPEVLNELLAVAPPVRSAGPAGLLAGSLRTDIEVAEAAPRLVPPEPVEAPPGVTPEPERPPVRLVSSTETEEHEAAVPFPWSPASGRPRRTPPSQVAGAAESKPEPVRRKGPSNKGGVKLTPEELAALLEQPPLEGGKAQEGGS